MANNIYENKGLKQVYSNMGALVALSDYGTTPTSNDILGELQDATGFGYKTDNIDTTSVSSTTGFSRTTPLKKTPNEGTVTVFKNNTDYKRVYNKYFGYNTSEEGYYCTLTISWPKGKDWTDVKDVCLDGYISGFNWADINTSSAQTFSFTFQPIGAPRDFAGFVDIESLSVNPTNLTAEGGSVVATITGTNLIDNLLVKGFVNNIAVPETVAYSNGTDTEQTATLTIPANSDTESVEYVIKASKDGGITFSDFVSNVTVAGV